MIAFLTGLGITLVMLFSIFAFIISFAGIIALLRAGLNKDLGAFGKIFWILGSFIPGVAFLYFAFVDRNPFLKFTGWMCLLFIIVTAVTGGTAVWGGFEALKDEIEHPSIEKPLGTPESPDDSSLSL